MDESNVELIAPLLQKNFKKWLFNLPASKLSCQEVEERNETSAQTGSDYFRPLFKVSLHCGD